MSYGDPSLAFTVFISYSTLDLSYVDLVREQLQSKYIDVYVSQYSSPHGSALPELVSNLVEIVRAPPCACSGLVRRDRRQLVLRRGATGRLGCLAQVLAHLGPQPLGERIQDIEHPMVPAPLPATLGPDPVKGGPDPQRAVADDQQRTAHAPLAQV